MQGWDWPGFFEYLTNPYSCSGAVTTLWLTAVSIVGRPRPRLRPGPDAAVAARRWLRRRPAFYVWLFRGTPLLVQLIVIYTGLPQFGIKFSRGRSRR